MPQELQYLEKRLLQARDLELLSSDISVRKAHRSMGDKYAVEIAARRLALSKGQSREPSGL